MIGQESVVAITLQSYCCFSHHTVELFVVMDWDGTDKAFPTWPIYCQVLVFGLRSCQCACNSGPGLAHLQNTCTLRPEYSDWAGPEKLGLGIISP